MTEGSSLREETMRLLEQWDELGAVVQWRVGAEYADDALALLKAWLQRDAVTSH